MSNEWMMCNRCLKIHEEKDVHNLKYRDVFPVKQGVCYRDGIRISLETVNKGCICPECVQDFRVKVANWFNWGEKDE